MSDIEPEVEKKLVRWMQVRIHFKALTTVQVNDLYVALAMPDDIRAERSRADAERGEDTLVSRFRAWGWGTNIDAFSGPPQPLRHIGVYYDYTSLEDDVRFMPIIAPFVERGSKAIFEFRETDPDDLTSYGYHGWDFDGRRVVRRKAEQFIEYEWA